MSSDGAERCALFCPSEATAVVDFDGGPEWSVCAPCADTYRGRLNTEVRSLSTETDHDRGDGSE